MSDKFYDVDSGGFYDSVIHKNIPSGAVKLSTEEYEGLKALLGAGHTVSLHKGSLVVSPPDVPTSAQLVDEARANRLAAYRIESDPLKIEAEHDAIVNGGGPDYSAWLAKVAEIKERYPFPVVS